MAQDPSADGRGFANRCVMIGRMRFDGSTFGMTALASGGSGARTRIKPIEPNLPIRNPTTVRTRGLPNLRDRMVLRPMPFGMRSNVGGKICEARRREAIAAVGSFGRPCSGRAHSAGSATPAE
jgi:hypothetical protein